MRLQIVPSPSDDVVLTPYQERDLHISRPETAGFYPDHFAAELQGRKRAAEYVAEQIRLAKAEDRDATPVLVALRDIPHLKSDPLARLVSEYARTYLRRSAMPADTIDRSDATLRHLENRPALPKFYRRKDADA